MNISDIAIRKENCDGLDMLVCQVKWADGHETSSAVLWRISDSDDRSPDEIAKFLKTFASAIERYARKEAA